MKKVIAIDLDDVLADLVESWVEVVNKNEDENVKPCDIKCWDIKKYFKCNKKVFTYLTYGFFRNLPVKKDSQEVVEKLSEIHDVYIVTSATKTPESLKAKVEWLSEHFPFISADKIVLCGNKSIIKADIMIDDGVHNLKTFSGKKILFDAPHNRSCAEFTRVRNWSEIKNILL